ncbi:hypothetical protein DFH07DRAFT_945807 [Mycena maculata]|uniref:Uncharacterized protein n=1 Tax=Mycena maculata TaxID=230809 RepID=A0AAD7HUP6_9AGAR|nr:hypothetical protein DFH07DRAFT_945807 [Mycena maculata]
MSGTIWACRPDEHLDSDNFYSDKALGYCDYRYSGFLDAKGIFLHASIAFLTALSAEQITKAFLVEKGVVEADAVEGIDDAVVIPDYRSRIDAAIPLLQSWITMKPAAPAEIFENPLFQALPQVGNLLFKERMKAKVETDSPIDLKLLDSLVSCPRSLNELNLSGIHAFCRFPDANGSMSYVQAKEVARMLRMVRPYCVWGENWIPPADCKALVDDKKPADGEDPEKDEDADNNEDPDDNEDGLHFIGELIHVFDAVPPGGTACN